jgi:hypothetical protein
MPSSPVRPPILTSLVLLGPADFSEPLFFFLSELLPLVDFLPEEVANIHLLASVLRLSSNQPRPTATHRVLFDFDSSTRKDFGPSFSSQIFGATAMYWCSALSSQMPLLT